MDLVKELKEAIYSGRVRLHQTGVNGIPYISIDDEDFFFHMPKEYLIDLDL